MRKKINWGSNLQHLILWPVLIALVGLVVQKECCSRMVAQHQKHSFVFFRLLPVFLTGEEFAAAKEKLLAWLEKNILGFRELIPGL